MNNVQQCAASRITILMDDNGPRFYNHDSRSFQPFTQLACGPEGKEFLITPEGEGLSIVRLRTRRRLTFAPVHEGRLDFEGHFKPTPYWVRKFWSIFWAKHLKVVFLNP